MVIVFFLSVVVSVPREYCYQSMRTYSNELIFPLDIQNLRKEHFLCLQEESIQWAVKQEIRFEG